MSGALFPVAAVEMLKNADLAFGSDPDKKIQTNTQSPSSCGAGIGSTRGGMGLPGLEGGCLAATEGERGRARGCRYRRRNEGASGHRACPPGSIRKLYDIFASRLLRMPEEARRKEC